jgi:hypothetical protein
MVRLIKCYTYQTWLKSAGEAVKWVDCEQCGGKGAFQYECECGNRKAMAECDVCGGSGKVDVMRCRYDRSLVVVREALGYLSRLSGCEYELVFVDEVVSGARVV